MNEIKAFVGHSFTPEDAAVVQAFLNYFERLSQLHSVFSWEHAEGAEPRLLAEKVLSLVADKNTFIAICTRKEKVIRPEKLQRVFSLGDYFKGRNIDFEWKTSDWIIQEIGMAKGRGLELILLVEEGVKRPGGLQGDVEYISFERDAPEKSFNKILEMITALSPKPVATAVPPQNVASAGPEDPKSAEADAGDKDKVTASIQSTTDYRNALVNAVVRKDLDAEKRVDQEYLASAEASEGENRFVWEAFKQLLHILFKPSGTLDRLKELACRTSGRGRSVVLNSRSREARFGFLETMNVMTSVCSYQRWVDSLQERPNIMLNT